MRWRYGVLQNKRIVDLKPSRDNQTIAGLIVSMRVMKNKKGDKMGFIVLDDRSGV